MKYLGGTGSGIGGGAVYPYNVSINGSNTPTLLLCDSYDNPIRLNETCKATVTPFMQGIATSMFASSMTLDYKAAGLIFKSHNREQQRVQWPPALHAYEWHPELGWASAGVYWV
jgi:hypothetical protein